MCIYQPVIKFKSQLYFEDKDEPAAAAKAFQPHTGSQVSLASVQSSKGSRRSSQIVFFKNGVSMGTAFADVPRGRYFPALSLYKSPTLRANFGPRFKAKPATGLPWRPVLALLLR